MTDGRFGWAAREVGRYALMLMASELEKLDVGASILAGGLSSRMGGGDKSRLRIGRRTLLGHARAAAAGAGFRVRVITEDAVERCGPLGGMLTGLESSRGRAELFLACDMPFVSVDLLRRVLVASHGGRRPVFASCEGRIGFPCLIPVGRLPELRECIAAKKLSLRELCAVLGATLMEVGAEEGWRLFNVNTSSALEEARRMTAAREPE